jgi:D-threo-aldose 1-dehydrogenase
MSVLSSVATRSVGRGPALTEFGVGTAQFGNLYRASTDEDSTAAVTAAWDAGVRYFDTAPHYGLGLSERRLGRALREYPREDYVVSTKVGRLLVPTPEKGAELDTDGFEVPATHRRVWDFSRDGILRSVEASLERLGLDRIDILYLHDPDEHWEEASTTGIGALIELREQGVVRAVGAGMNQSAMLTEFVRRCDVDVVMVAGRFTLLEQGALQDLLPQAADRGVGVVAAAVYNSGLLSQPEVPADARYNYGGAPPDVIERARAIVSICRSHGITLPDAAVQYPLLRPEVVSVVLGCRTAGHVQSNTDRYATTVPAAFWDELVAADLIPPLVGVAERADGSVAERS